LDSFAGASHGLIESPQTSRFERQQEQKVDGAEGVEWAEGGAGEERADGCEPRVFISWQNRTAAWLRV